MISSLRFFTLAAVSLILTGCTLHPRGEAEERRSALEAGREFDHEQASPFPENATTDDMVRRALESNQDLQQKYWEWRAAIEQIPQDGTQTTNLALFSGLGITNGSTRLGSATLGVGNDPMADILLPPKLSIAAKRAYENARAAGLRFRKAQFELRAKVLSAHADYALTAELARLEEENAQLLQTAVMVVEAKNRSGTGGQQDLLRSRNELDLSRNDARMLRSELPSAVATLNALLDRPTDAPLPLPQNMPPSRPLVESNDQVLKLLADRNPELAAEAREISASKERLKLARLQYLPDFSLSLNSDLAGVTQSLAGMITVPLLRYEAINAAVAQAQANIRAMDAMRRQTGNDLAAKVVLDLNGVRDSDRQLDLFEHTVLPRAKQVVTVGRSAYEAGQSTLLDLLDAQRSLVSIERLVANLQAVREKQLLELEAITASPLASSSFDVAPL
jgi:hypothetical protein